MKSRSGILKLIVIFVCAILPVLSYHSGYAQCVADPALVGTDIGSPGMAGSSSGPTGGLYNVSGGGGDIWGTSDQFQYDYTVISGDGQMIARETQNQDATGNGGGYAKSGIM